MASEPDAGLSMSCAQRAAAYLAILAFGVPSVLVALIGGEAWPFLDYRMYADVKPTSEVEWLALVGRTANDAPFPLDNELYITPFAPSELLRALYSLDILGETNTAPARRALQGLLAAYNRGRRTGEHNGPPLIALEVYRLQWDDRLRSSSETTPDTQTLIQTIRLPDITP